MKKKFINLKLINLNLLEKLIRKEKKNQRKKSDLSQKKKDYSRKKKKWKILEINNLMKKIIKKLIIILI